MAFSSDLGLQTGSRKIGNNDVFCESKNYDSDDEYFLYHWDCPPRKPQIPNNLLKIRIPGLKKLYPGKISSRKADSFYLPSCKFTLQESYENGKKKWRVKLVDCRTTRWTTFWNGLTARIPTVTLEAEYKEN